jgi:quercetin dioxygenase-like cupin family protein
MRRNLAPVGIVVALLLCASWWFSVAAVAQPAGQPPVATKVGAAKFVTLPNVPGCMTVAVKRGDPGKSPASVLVKMTPSCDSRTHWHSADASVVVVSGKTQLEMKGEKTAAMLQGDYVFMPAYHIHEVSQIGGFSREGARTKNPPDTPIITHFKWCEPAQGGAGGVFIAQ